MFPKASACGKNPDVPQKTWRSKNFWNSNQKDPEVPQDPDVTKRSGCFFKNPEVTKKSECLKKIQMFPKAFAHEKRSGCSQKHPHVKKIRMFPKVQKLPEFKP